MDANSYMEILRDVVLPYADENMPIIFKFQQDNDPKHTSRLVKKQFQENKVNVLDWPSQSPDLNPIENLWAILKQNIGNREFKNKDQLWHCVQESWYKISPETCQNLIESMPRRLNAVLTQKGGYSGY